MSLTISIHQAYLNMRANWLLRREGEEPKSTSTQSRLQYRMIQLKDRLLD